MNKLLRNRMVDGFEVAPDGCVICHKLKPDTETAQPGWAYIAGSTPVGAITCSQACLRVAIDRYGRTGRVDTPEMRAPEVS
jgi:hypothetical protein